MATRASAARASFRIRHEDHDILVVEKAAGILTVSTPHARAPDLVTILRKYTARGKALGEILAAHRLDRPVSGLLVLARDRRAHQGLIEQFAAHTVERRYVAVADGLIAEESGTFESHLVESPDTFEVRRAEPGQGRRAVTHWWVRTRYERARATMVDVQLETGVKNQIRFHFAEHGHPLLGERKYLPEGAEERTSVQGERRIFLHAAVLGFLHPTTGEKLRFESKLPPDLELWQRELSRQAALPSRKKDRHRDRKNKGKRRTNPDESGR